MLDIEIEEYEQSATGLIAYENYKIILPGETISKIPVIVNRGDDCRVRVQIRVDGVEAITADQIYGMPDGWRAGNDGYFYYDEILHEGDQVTIFEGIQIPEDLSEQYEGDDFQVTVTAQASSLGASTETSSGTTILSRVKTGDNCLPGPWIVVLCAAVFAVCMAAKWLRSPQFRKKNGSLRR